METSEEERRARIDELCNAARASLADGDLEATIDAAEELLELRFTAGFEFLALAQSARGDLELAIKTLETGVEQAPTVWLLWQLLGNLRSDAERFDDADAAYVTALTCPGADRASVTFNRATVLSRRGRPEAALELLDALPPDLDQGLAFHAVRLRVNVLDEAGRHVDAISTADAALENLESNHEASILLAGRAEAKLHLGDRAESASDAWRAIEYDKQNTHAAWMIRELEGRTSPEARQYDVLLEGTWSEPLEPGQARPGFFTTTTVVATSEEDAFALAARFEPPEVRRTLRASEITPGEFQPDAPTGVYRAGGYSFYSAEE